MGAFSEPSEAPEQRFWQNKLDISLKKLSRNQIEETKNGGKFEFQTLTAIFGRKMASYQKMFFLTEVRIDILHILEIFHFLGSFWVRDLKWPLGATPYLSTNPAKTFHSTDR